MPEEKNTEEKNNIYRTLGRIDRTLEAISYGIRELANLKNQEVNPIVSSSDGLEKQEEMNYLREQIREIRKQNKILMWTAIVGWAITLFITLIRKN